MRCEHTLIGETGEIIIVHTERRIGLDPNGEANAIQQQCAQPHQAKLGVVLSSSCMRLGTKNGLAAKRHSACAHAEEKGRVQIGNSDGI